MLVSMEGSVAGGEDRRGDRGDSPEHEQASSKRVLGIEDLEMVDVAAASDATLVVAVGRWNEAALAEIYRRHGGAVHSLARRLLGSDARADDATQEVFVDLWRRPERFDPSRGSLRGFLLTVVHGKAVDLMRSESARASREERSAREVVSTGYDMDSEMWDLAVSDKVRTAVSELPDPERQAIELAYFGGLTYKEVARALGEAEGTVKSRIRRALQRLRSTLVAEVMTP
jgi:RNA polymerase sigma-70 factor (ECF subfamily)